jgi:hypothetical protein
MKFTAATLLALAALARAQLENLSGLTPEQSSVVLPIVSKMAKIEEHSEFGAFTTAAAEAQSEWAMTQTIVDMDATAAPTGSKLLEYIEGFASANIKFASTQTVITGAAKTSLVDVQDDFWSVVQSVAVESIAATATGSEETATETGAAAPSDEEVTSGFPSATGARSTTVVAVTRTPTASAPATESAAAGSGAVAFGAGGLLAGVVAGVAAVAAVL